MIKPYISLKIQKEGHDFVLKSAEYRIPRKGSHPLKIDRVCDIINRYDESIYEKRANGEYRITDERIIKELLARKVERRNNHVGKAIAVVSLVAMVTTGTASLIHTSTSKIVPHIPEKPIFGQIEQTVEAKPKILAVKTADISYFNDEDNSLISNYTDGSQAIDSTTVFSYDYKDKSQNEEYIFVLNNQEYQDAIQKYAPMYGVDPALISAKISQENPNNIRNDSNIGARGVSQIESIWWGHELTAYNFETKSYETIVVDGDKLYDPDYAIKLGCMILSETYHSMSNNFVTDGVLTDSECIIAALTAYNMGGPTISNLIRKYGADYINHRDEINWGDKMYYEHVLSYLEDGTKITFLNLDETESCVYVDNMQTNNFTK